MTTVPAARSSSQPKRWDPRQFDASEFEQDIQLTSFVAPATPERMGLRS